jgi:two-component system chemotaxis sensor kinase CheA
MSNLSKEFLKQTISNLISLQDQLSQVSNKRVPDDFIKHYFQKLHTLKGSSQTFSFNDLATISHEIENLLQAIQNKQIPQNQATYVLILESLAILSETAKSYQDDSQPVDYKDFFTRIRNINPKQQTLPEFDFSKNSLPPNIIERLSTQEKSNLARAIQNETSLLVLEAKFTMSDFYHGFKNLKETLENCGQSIAVLPNSGKESDEMSLQIVYSTKLSGEEISSMLRSFPAKITFEIDSNPKHFLSDISQILNDLIAVGKSKSFKLNKNIDFQLSLDDGEMPQDDGEMPQKYLLLLNEIGSHLLNNAIDHAIESPEQRILCGKSESAKITISLLKLENTFQFIVEDDGRGINLSEISEIAVENRLIESDRNLLETDVLDLIFKQGFSTSETVSSMSGRGVGLAAVKALIEEATGKIEVKTKFGSGTKFTVYLPAN